MIKRMIKHGNSRVLVIDRGIRQLLNIKDNTPLDITTDGHSLIVSPVIDKERRKNLDYALRRSDKKFSQTYKRLAETEDNSESAISNDR